MIFTVLYTRSRSNDFLWMVILLLILIISEQHCWQQLPLLLAIPPGGCVAGSCLMRKGSRCSIILKFISLKNRSWKGNTKAWMPQDMEVYSGRWSPTSGQGQFGGGEKEEDQVVRKVEVRVDRQGLGIIGWSKQALAIVAKFLLVLVILYIILITSYNWWFCLYIILMLQFV